MLKLTSAIVLLSGKKTKIYMNFAQISVLGQDLAQNEASLQEILKLSDEQLTAFTADFEARLTKYLRNALHPETVAAFS